MWNQFLFGMCLWTAGHLVVAGERSEPPFVRRCQVLRSCAKTKLAFINKRLQQELRDAATEQQRREAKVRALTTAADVSKSINQMLLTELAGNVAEPAAVETLTWIADSRRSPLADKAAALLSTHHLSRRETLDVALRNAPSPMRWTQPLLRELLQALPPTDDNHPRVLLALAAQKQFDGRFARQLAAMSADAARQLRLLHGDETIEACRTIDSERADEEALDLFAQLEDRYGTRRAAGNATFGRIARSAMFEIRHLSVGHVAPNLEGDDLSGKRMTLNEHQGNVVLLLFWAAWCEPCMERLSHDSEFVARFADKPFVLLGVNADPDKTTAISAMNRLGISWRSFWCGPQGQDGDIPWAWNIQAWPTTYVIDHFGVIRAKDPDDEALGRLLEELVSRAKRDAGSTPRQ